MTVAVYTDVVAEELGAFLADYDVGELLAYKGIAEGVENSNFLVHTSRGYFILTLYERRVAAALRELPPTSERSAARLRVFPRCRAFTSRKCMAVKIVTRHNSRRSLS